MNKNLTDLTVILDRSGSMATCVDDAEKGLNYFIEQQKKNEGSCIFSLVKFDDEIENAINGLDIREVGKIKLEPRGSTNLNDAIGKTIVATGERLRLLPERERPGLVVMVIVTDGGHNVNTCEFSTQRVKEMIKHQEEKYNWQFVYLGANQDAFAVSSQFGFQQNKTSNYKTKNLQETWSSNSGMITRMRSAGACGQSMSSIGYTEDEVKAMNTDNTN